MKNGLFRICSMILVIVLLINMLPLQVIAQQLNSDRDEQIQTETIQPEDNIPEAKIVEEIPQKRTEYSKEYLLGNGLHMINVYPEAVHYATENGWEEIDNTLIAKADGTISNTAGVWDVSFPQQLSKDKSISIKKDGYTLSFFMAGEITSGNMLMQLLEPAKAADAETVSVTSMKQSAATIQTQDLSAVQQIEKHEQKMLQKTQSRLIYTNVYQNTDVIYDLKSNKVKESIVMESYDSALRGYRYTLDVGTMVPVLEEDGQIIFYDSNREKVVFVMPAPYMIDNGGVHNYDVQVQLTGSGSRYTMTYTLPQRWLAAEDRAWPVILDPVVEPALTTTNIRDRTVVNQGSFSQTWGMNSCGRYSNGDITRTFLKYDNLPELTSSDVIVGATVHMYKPNTSSTVTTVYAHKVLGTWASETISWSNKPAYNTTIEDYAIVDGVDWYCWDITDVVRGWYSGANTGVMFKADDEIENGSTANFKEFYSSDYGNNKPVLSITFRNNNGLESYWDYTTASAGRAGTGYINNYTGNLTWVREDLGFSGNRMPVSISHIYNANDAYSIDDSNNSNNSAGNGFGLGNGWRTNYNQLVYQWSENSWYYIWEDTDGTDHYFLQSASGEYKDEDGLELTLTTTGSGTEKYKIIDKNGNISYFDSYGRLSKIENNQLTKSNITITYEGTSRRIKTITDGVGRKYNFEYENGLLYSIDYLGYGTEPTHSMSYDYEGSDLVYIYDNGGSFSEYTYGSRNLLISATDTLGYSLNYTYNTAANYQPSRVLSVEERQDEFLVAGKLTFEYEHNQTTVTEWICENGGNTLIYQFNNMGNTISVQDNEGHAQYYKYAINGDETETGRTLPHNAKTNQLRVTSKLQNTVVNILEDSSFEVGNLWNCTWGAPTAAIVTTQSYFGNKSIQTTTTQNGTGIHENTYTLAPGETVTFSAYVKTGSATACLLMYYWTGSTASEQLSPNSDWTRLEVTYTNKTSASQNVCPHILTTTPGTFWADGVQMEYATTASRYNLIDNGDFRYGGYNWSSSAGIATRDAAAPQLEDTVFTIPGSTTDIRHLIQTVRVNGGEGDSFILSGWAKGNAAPLWEKEEGENKREFALQLFFNYTDGTKSSAFTAQFNPDSTQWQYSAVAAVATKAYSSITVQCVYDYNVNRIMFDGIQLFKEEFGASYIYDADGNVVSVTDLQKQNTTYGYTNNNLTGIIESNGNEVSYTYDSYHNVLTATAKNGQVYHFTYDAYGNNTSVYTTVDGITMSTTATYSADGNQLLSTTDALGKVTTYGYDADTGLLEWVQYPEDTISTRTNYSYDGNGRLVSVSAATDTENTQFADYFYIGESLVEIITENNIYSIDCGDFGLVNGIWAGDYTLASYYYTEDGNYFLDALEYGNYSMVQYSYDERGRLIKEYLDDGTIAYAYNNDGQLAVVTDSASGITTKYYYDLVGRIVKQEEKGTGFSHIVQQTFDEVNNLASLQETINGITHSNEFGYDAYDRVSSVTNSNVSEQYHYDGFSRIDQSTTKHDNSVVLVESYTFTTPNPNVTSGQIATNRLQAEGYDVTYSYTYDGNGNILSISDGTNTTSYVYDSANQLLREDNQAGGFTHTWEYDCGGNILNRKKYAYTTGALGTPIDTIIYDYEDYTWGDLLTGYDGQSIDVDEIGNTVYDGTWDYIWRNGRELAYMIKDDQEWAFEYDVNGMRTERSDCENITYQYVYNGSSLSQMTVGNNTLYFAYGANGVPMSVTYNGTTYYYVTNIQGDVIAILDAAGNLVVSYSYDAWGNPISTTGSMAGTLGVLNPLRYRGYVYDQETGLYYLQSRYYNPEWGRFISADAFVSTGQGILGNNMFAYCLNNPINLLDGNGKTAEVLHGWTLSMGWLCAVDFILPIGDIVYVGGILVLGIITLAVNQDDVPQITFDDIGGTCSSPSPNKNDDEDDDYYDDDSNFGGRQKIGKSKGSTPGNNQTQNKQFDDATKGLPQKIKRMIHDEISGTGSGYHDIRNYADDFYNFKMK